MFKKYPLIEHMLIVGKPGTYKDITAVRLCHEGYVFGKKIFSNLHLDFESKYIDKYDQFINLKGDNWNPSIAYIHDVGVLFHCREFKIGGQDKIDSRKGFVNNYRKRGIQIIGTLHREGEVDIEIRKIIDWFVYPYVVNTGDPNNMEDDIVVLEYYDTPDMKENGEKPIYRTFYDQPQRYAKMFDTLEETTI